MNKRNSDVLDRPAKKAKIEEINVVKKIIIRNDDDPHVFVNLDCPYVKIGDFIYKTRMFTENWNIDDADEIDDMVGLNLTQYNDISDFVFGENRILVSNFYNYDPPI